MVCNIYFYNNKEEREGKTLESKKHYLRSKIHCHFTVLKICSSYNTNYTCSVLAVNCKTQLLDIRKCFYMVMSCLFQISYFVHRNF